MARIRDWATALGEVAQSGPLRRAQASFGAMWASESAFMVGLAVVAFRDGGVVAVGAVTGARMAAAALIAPFLATVADRVRRELVLTGVGVLNAAVGAGGVLGSVVAFTLVGRGGLATWFGVGIALFGAPLTVVGLAPEQAAAIVLLGVVGVGNALIDVGGFTLLARLADERVLARMFASFEAILTLGVAAGGLVTPPAVELLGVRPALVATGLLAPVAVTASWPALRRLDAEVRVRDADIETMRPIRMLGAL